MLLVCFCFVFKKMELDVFWEVNPHKFYNDSQCLVMVSLFIVCSDSWLPRACLRMQIQHPSFMWTNLKKETDFSSCSWLMYHSPRSGKNCGSSVKPDTCVEHVDSKLDWNWVWSLLVLRVNMLSAITFFSTRKNTDEIVKKLSCVKVTRASDPKVHPLNNLLPNAWPYNRVVCPN